jgi:hypothetical protein
MMSRRSLILLAGAFVLTGQQSSDRYGPLIRALALTDAQVAQLQDSLGPVLLDGAQRVKLAETAKVLLRFGTSAGAVVMGLMDAEEWPTGWPCPISYGHGVYASEFDLTADQVQRFEQLQHDVQQRANDQLMEIGNRYWKLLAGQSVESPERAALLAETSTLVKQRDQALPPRNLATAVLNETQKAKVAAFRASLELAREALELRLIRLPGLPEVLCH